MSKKLLMLTWEYPPNIVGGLSRHVEGLAMGLSDLGYEIHIITTQIEGLSSYEKHNNCEIFRVKPLNDEEANFLHWVGGLNLAIVDKVLELSQFHEYEFIHAHDWLVGAAAATLKESLLIPLFTTVHATEHGRNQGIHTEMQKKIHDYEQALVNMSDLIISCSPFMCKEIKTVYFVNEDKIAMIPNGINTSVTSIPYNTEELISFPLDRSKKLVFSIGRMVKEKGFETLIEAARITKERQLDYYFIIAGKGPMLTELQQASMYLDNIHFIGFISEVEREAMFAACDVAVFPSLYEPFGIVALESMIQGKPTIVSKVGGLKGIIQHNETGLYMVPDDPESLISQLEYLFESNERAILIGQKGKQLVEHNYSWKKIAEQTKKVFDQFLMNLRR